MLLFLRREGEEKSRTPTSPLFRIRFFSRTGLASWLKTPLLRFPRISFSSSVGAAAARTSTPEEPFMAMTFPNTLGLEKDSLTRIPTWLLEISLWPINGEDERQVMPTSAPLILAYSTAHSSSLVPLKMIPFHFCSGCAASQTTS